MKASIGDVALKAGVSNATVSRTFAHPEQVSEATRLKVQAAADALNFSVSRSAGILKSGRTYRIALLVGSGVIEWFTAEIIAGLNDVLRDAGYDLAIYPIEGRKRVTHSSRNFPYAATPMPYSFPHWHQPPTRSNVSEPQKFLDYRHQYHQRRIRCNCRYQRQRRHQTHRSTSRCWDIVTCCIYMKAFPPHWDSAHLTRISGFQEACDAIDGLTARTLAVQKGDSILDAAISEIMAQDNPPTALCFHQDSQAIPLFFRLQRSGLSVPGDISVTG